MTNEFEDGYFYDPYGYYNGNQFNENAYDPYREQMPTLLPTATIENEIKLGRTGHYYRTRLASFGELVTIQLLGINPTTGMVSMNVYMPQTGQWMFHQEHKSDMFGLTYLGPTPPPLGGQGGTQGGGPGGTQGGGQGTGTPRPPWCQQYSWFPGC